LKNYRKKKIKKKKGKNPRKQIFENSKKHILGKPTKTKRNKIEIIITENQNDK
jgi:hypothetical protein